MLRLVAIEHLDFVAVLQIDAAVAARLHDQKFDVQTKIAVGFLGDDVRRAILPACGDWIIAHHGAAFIHRILHDFPFDRHRGFEARPFPINPLFIQHRTRAVHDDLRARWRFCADADLGKCCVAESECECGEESCFHDEMDTCSA